MKATVKALSKSLHRLVGEDVLKRKTDGFKHIQSRQVYFGSEHAYRLPFGYSCTDVQKNLDKLISSIGHPIELIDRGGAVVLRVIEKDFPPKIEFKDENGKGLLVGYDRLMNPIFHPMNTHLLVGGASNSGKTVFLRNAIYTLAKQGYQIYISDLKGISFFPFEALPNVHVVDNLYDASDLLDFIVAEINRRKSLIKQRRDRSIVKEFVPIAFIVDEGAVYAPAQNTGEDRKIAQKCDQQIAYIGQQSREFKVFSILCYQRPDSKTINAQYKANIEATICFRVTNHHNSEVIMDKPGAETISPTARGRCFYTYDRDYLLQVPFATDEEWERHLAPLRQEVLHAGSSHRSQSQRTYLDGIVTSADRNDETTVIPERLTKPLQESLIHPQSTARRKVSGLPLPRKKENMEFKPKSKERTESYSDEIG